MKKAFILLFVAACFVLGADLSEKTTLGGYGESHLNYENPEYGDAAAPIMDFHRWVLFVGHQFTPQWKVFAELELEHNFVNGGQGDFKLEQAYIEYSPLTQLNVQVGVVLVSSGLINEYHEPNEFLSVERPAYNKQIIPTTWFGNGLALHGTFAKNLFRYKAVVLEGLDDRNFRTKDAIRKGRQSGYKSSFDNILFNGSVDYTGLPGLVVGGSFAFNTNVKDIDTAAPHLYDNTLLSEVHAKYKSKGIWAQAEFGTINYWAKEGAVIPVEFSQGIYADLGYDVARLWGAEKLQLYPFIRYSQVNSAGHIFTNDDATTPYTQKIMGGLSLMPIKNIAIKVDLGLQQTQYAVGYSNILNIGVGYSF